MNYSQDKIIHFKIIFLELFYPVLSIFYYTNDIMTLIFKIDLKHLKRYFIKKF